MKKLSLWQQILRKNFTCSNLLADFLELDEVQRKKILSAPYFRLNLPLRLAQKIQKKTLNDPILLQFCPLLEEQNSKLNFLQDPVGDRLCKKTNQLLQKYEGRVLLICSGACAMHCRYCFRQNFEYTKSMGLFENEIAYIKGDSSIKEVILSGGDPLSLSHERLSTLLKQLNGISHIKRIRFHTRFPIGIPERIDEEFLDLLGSLQKQIWFIVHINHVKELDSDIFRHLRLLQKMGIVVGNQSVLLKNVNDNVQALKELCECLADHGIIPYYLHQLDRVQGASHFEVPEFLGIELVKELQKSLSGYAIPKYVKEIPGEKGKTPIF